MDHRPSARRVAALCVAATAAAVTALLAAPSPAGANFASPTDTAFNVYAHHPLWRGAGAPRPQPALVRHYGVKVEVSRPGRRYTRSSRYLPGGSRFRRASDIFPNPVLDGDAAGEFAGWDLLRLPYYGLDVYDWAEVALNRDARLCLALGDRVEPWLRVAGYERVGVAVLPAGAGVTVDGGPPPNKVGLFCKDVSAGVLTLPRATLLGISGPFAYDVILAEKGGLRPVRPAPPPGVQDIYPNTRCPNGLHELWRTGAHDSADGDTSWKTWRTWHPQVDPIYWWYVWQPLVLLVWLMVVIAPSGLVVWGGWCHDVGPHGHGPSCVLVWPVCSCCRPLESSHPPRVVPLIRYTWMSSPASSPPTPPHLQLLWP